jgi:hypothetical protein
VAYTVLFVFFGTFGSAIPAVRDGSSGLLGRIALTGAAPWRIILERTLAGAALDLAQLLPAILLIAAVGRAGITAAASAVVAVSLALTTANLIGVWVAALARSIAEAALFGAVFALLLLHASGVFRTPGHGSLGWLVESVSPYRALHELTLWLAGGPGVAAPSAAFAAAAVWVVAGCASTSLAGRWILARLVTGDSA